MSIAADHILSTLSERLDSSVIADFTWRNTTEHSESPAQSSHQFIQSSSATTTRDDHAIEYYTPNEIMQTSHQRNQLVRSQNLTQNLEQALNLNQSKTTGEFHQQPMVAMPISNSQNKKPQQPVSGYVKRKRDQKQTSKLLQINAFLSNYLYSFHVY